MPKKIDWNKKLEDWRELVESLMADITKWAQQQGWQVHRDEKLITEENLGEYSVPDLVIRLPEGRISVDVAGRNTIGADGRVDISAFPSLNRMLLVRVGDKWKIKTDSHVSWPREWGKKAFIELARLLASSR
jgi:hypothetical protein